jgi:(4S)-4-hydroxy-5-phosphonooxypentane-2,3-dione isomerase
MLRLCVYGAGSSSRPEENQDNSMHIVSVTVTIKEEMLAEFERAILHNARESIAKDPGCLRFDVSQSYEEPTMWLFHEVYDAPDAHAAHRQSPHFHAYAEVEKRAAVDKRVIRAAGRHVTPAR